MNRLIRSYSRGLENNLYDSIVQSQSVKEPVSQPIRKGNGPGYIFHVLENSNASKAKYDTDAVQHHI